MPTVVIGHKAGKNSDDDDDDDNDDGFWRSWQRPWWRQPWSFGLAAVLALQALFIQAPAATIVLASFSIIYWVEQYLTWERRAAPRLPDPRNVGPEPSTPSFWQAAGGLFGLVPTARPWSLTPGWSRGRGRFWLSAAVFPHSKEVRL